MRHSTDARAGDYDRSPSQQVAIAATARFVSPFAPTSPDAVTFQAFAKADPPSRGWRLSVPTAARWSVAVAVAMSTQYLFQPFVWAHWPVDEVLLGWLEVVFDRVLMALCIALALAEVTRLRARRLSTRALLIAAAIVSGAAVGEIALLFSGSPGVRRDESAVLGSVIQWTLLALCISGMYYLWARSNNAYAAARASELQRSMIEALRVQTELQSLRHQIDPHFLFNTLATIRRLNETGPRDGAKLLRHLLDYLRSTMPVSARHTTLGEEVDLVTSHLAIVALRMGGRLAVRFDVPDELRECACPPLTLATLVENAVKHGITPSPNGGTIVVSARRDGDSLELRVEDTGVGMSVPEASFGGTGIGLANTRARLRVLYGDRGSLALAANAPRGVRAIVRLPWDQRLVP